MDKEKIEIIQNILECFKVWLSHQEMYTTEQIKDLQNAYLKTIDTVLKIYQLNGNGFDEFEDDLK